MCWRYIEKSKNYLAELVFPSKSAYSIHVMKMCDELAKRDINTNLHILNKEKKLNFYDYYNCKKKFKINNFKIKKNNFLGRIFFSYKLVKLILPKKIL